MGANQGEVTQLLMALRHGNRDAEAQLIPLVYRELRRIAGIYMRKEDPRHSLQPTALVHEAYLRLTRVEQIDWEGRSHFFAVAATLMRRILVDHARNQGAQKRGRGWDEQSLNEATLPSPERAPEILALDEAMDRLALLDQRQAKVVELRFFAGMNEEETGLALGVSARTVKRDWRLAKAWLYNELQN